MPSETLNSTKLKTYLPKANNYLLSELEYNSSLKEEELKKEIASLKQKFNLQDEDDLLIDVLLFRQSKLCISKKAEALKAQKILQNLANQVSLAQEYYNLLNHVYGQVSSRTLVQNVKGDCTINSLLEKITEPRVVLKFKAEDNLKFITNLYNNKKITLKTFRHLHEVYAFEGSPELKKDFGVLLDEVTAISPNFNAKEELVSKVLLAEISKEELVPMLNLYNNFPYSLTLEDLEVIYFKYSTLPEGEILKIFKAILMRLPYKEEPYENLALAVKILKDGKEEVFNNSLNRARLKQDRLNYMKALAKVPFFVGYQDELTLKFYGKKTLMEVGLEFKELLQNLPFIGNYKENADIGIKIMLGKIPFKAGYAQALYRKENRAKLGEDPIKIEALQKYSGPQSKEEVLEFFRIKLKPYTFYKNNGGAYCAALAYLIDELNGKNPPKATIVALELFEQGVKEKQVEEILNKFLQKVSFDAEALLTAYKRFYEIKHDREDAVARVLNMLD